MASANLPKYAFCLTIGYCVLLFTLHIVTGNFEFVNIFSGIFQIFLRGGYMSELLERVYRLMNKQNIKPTQLAKQLGMSTSTFTDWGKGKGSPSLKAVMQFAEYFGVSLDYLVYGREYQAQNIVEISNLEDEALLKSFHKLTPELRLKASGYIEGMVAAMPSVASTEDATKLSG